MKGKVVVRGIQCLYQMSNLEKNITDILMTQIECSLHYVSIRIDKPLRKMSLNTKYIEFYFRSQTHKCIENSFLSNFFQQNWCFPFIFYSRIEWNSDQKIFISFALRKQKKLKHKVRIHTIVCSHFYDEHTLGHKLVCFEIQFVVRQNFILFFSEREGRERERERERENWT